MKKKLLTAALALILVLACVSGTYAFLTDQELVTNTFTMGNVDIKLTEAKVDENGKATQERTDQGNEYKLFPGAVLDKDPTVTVLANSESSYVRIVVTVGNLDKLKTAITKADHADFYSGDIFLLQKLVGGWDSSKWEFAGFDAAGSAYEFRYCEAVDTLDGKDADLPALFTTITVPDFVDGEDLEKMADVTVSIEADAIQASGFENAEKAWEAFSK